MINGMDGGFLGPETNNDTTADLTCLRGSGGGGGGGGYLYRLGAGGGGGAGGGAISLIAECAIEILGCVTALGGGGGCGGQNGQGNGGWGGGGAGGGILIKAVDVRIAGYLDNCGRQKNTLSSVNGGTVKIIYTNKSLDSACISTGRLYTNGRPAVVRLESPRNNTGTSAWPLFKWCPAEDPDGDAVTAYQLQVSTTPDFKTLTLDAPDIKGSQFAPSVQLTELAYFWRVRAADMFGFGHWCEPWKFYTDNVSPLSAVHLLPEYVNTTTFNLSWSGTDDRLGIANYTIWVSEGDRPFGAWMESAVDSSAAFTGIDGFSYRFYSTAIDLAGNREAPPLAPDTCTTVDATAPVSTIEGLAPYQRTARFPVNWTGRDNTSGIAFFTVYCSQNEAGFAVWQDSVTCLSAVYEGIPGDRYTFFVVAQDRAGNREAMPGLDGGFSTVVDTDAPKTVFVPGTPSFGKNPVFLRPTTEYGLNATDLYGSVECTFYQMDEGPVSSYEKPQAEAGLGSHNITFWSVDAAGNEEQAGREWFMVENDPPSVGISFAGPNISDNDRIFITSKTSIVLTAEDNGSGVGLIEYALDGNDFIRYMAPFNISGSGACVLTFQAVDNLEYRSSEMTKRLVVDDEPPETVAAIPTNRSRETLKITFSGTDEGIGLDATFVRITRIGVNPLAFQKGTEVVLPAARDHSLDGTYLLEYYSVDRLGNAEEARSAEVRIDTRVDLTLNLNGDIYVEMPRFLLQGRTEPGSNVTVNGNPVQLLPDGQFVYDLRLSEGQNGVAIVVTDPAGNTHSVAHTISHYRLILSDALWSVLVFVVIAVAVISYLVLRRRRRKRYAVPSSSGNGDQETTD